MNDTLNFNDIFYFDKLYQSDNQKYTDSISQNYMFVTEHAVSEIEPKIRIKNDVVSEWNLLIVLVSFFAIILFKQLYPRKFRLLYSASYGSNNLNQLLREWNPTKRFFGYILLVLYLFNISLFLKNFFFDTNHSLNYSESELFLKIFAIFSIVYLSKLFLIFLLSWLFNTKEATKRYLTLSFSIALNSLIVLLSVLLVVMYNPFKIIYIIGIIVIVAFALYRFIKSFLESMSFTHFSAFYIFLYFCTLEIIPSLILLKLCSNLFLNN